MGLPEIQGEGMGLKECFSVGVSDIGPKGSAQGFFSLQVNEFMFVGIIGKVPWRIVVQPECKSLFLLFIKIRNAVGKIKLPVKSELEGHPEGFISSPEIIFVKPDPVIDAVQVMVVVVPPFVKIPVRKFKDGSRKNVPPFCELNKNIDMIVCQIQSPD